MNDRKIQTLLQDALERDVPAAEISLWPAVRAELAAAGPSRVAGKEKMKSTRPALSAAFVIAGLLALAFFTPPGRAFARELLQFFRRSESYTLPLPGGSAPSPESASAPTAPPPAPLVSVAEAEKLAGFDARELPSVPTGFTFAGAMATAQGLTIEYQAQGNGGQLILQQSSAGFLQSDWDQAPAEAISQVRVRGLEAEFVQGAYVVFPGETVARWNPDVPILRLRWIEDGIWFEMAKSGAVESIAYLDRAALIALAESLVPAP